MSDIRVEFLVIGGGIAGISLASELAPLADVALLDMESVLGFHATGRSAAVMEPLHGLSPVNQLVARSASFLRNPPPTFSDTPLLHKIGGLYVAGHKKRAVLQRALSKCPCDDIETLSADDMAARFPYLKPAEISAGLFDPRVSNIDVHALSQGYKNRLIQLGGSIYLNAKVIRIQRKSSKWFVNAGKIGISANILVNAAGAWGDQIAKAAGVLPIGLSPLRRTLAVVKIQNLPYSKIPLISEIDDFFYFKSEGEHVLISAGDETLSQPKDVQADEIDVAIAIERIQTATSLRVSNVVSKWAGLRTYTKDRIPTIGYDPSVENFFWCVGQGGDGIQIAPAIASISANLISQREASNTLDNDAFPKIFSPQRFRFA